MEKIESFGFLNINKPKGMSSHSVVYVLRKITGIKQIGHSGTLDPLAEGVLVVGVGKATRLFEYLKEKKEYIATMKFGYDSDTLDVEGNCIKKEDYFPDEEELKEVIKTFIGNSEQVPPKYSAIKVNGKKLYEMARKGQDVGALKARPIKINSIELLDINDNEAIIKVECSKGTYVRSLIRDIAKKLGTTAVMSGLVRTKSGAFCIENSIELNENIDSQEIQQALINPVEVLEYNKIEIDEEDLKKVKNGCPVEFGCGCDLEQNETVILTYENKIVSIASLIGKILVQKKVLI